MSKIANAFKNGELTLVNCKGDLKVPDADIILEGSISVTETHKEGPFVDLTDTPDDGHGGADTALTADFIKFIRGDSTSVSCTSIENSIAGHRVVFLADKSRENNGQTMYI